MRKLKDWIIDSSTGAETKVNIESVYYEEIIGGLECHFELLVNKIDKLHGEDWERIESYKCNYSSFYL